MVPTERDYFSLTREVDAYEAKYANDDFKKIIENTAKVHDSTFEIEGLTYEFNYQVEYKVIENTELLKHANDKRKIHNASIPYKLKDQLGIKSSDNTMNITREETLYNTRSYIFVSQIIQTSKWSTNHIKFFS